MKTPGLRLIRTQAFRIVLLYALLFALSVTALLGFTYWNTRRTLDAQADQIIQAEITGLLARRDKIVQFFEAGGEKVLFTLEPRP